MTPPIGWTIDQYRAGYRDGARLAETIAAVLGAFDEPAAAAVLTGTPPRRYLADEIDRLRRVAPDGLPLYGVPFVVKDNIDVAGLPTTSGCPSTAFVPARDAGVVARLRASGAVVVGKANMDQFATGLVGTRSPLGTPRNVFDSSLVPGGSSSGSAVAVALGCVPFALGTDTAGSGRVPAAANGVVGLKPTIGRLSGSGIAPAVRRLDCASVFARTVPDAALVARLATGTDDDDPYGRRAPRSPTQAVRVVGVPECWPSRYADRRGTPRRRRPPARRP